jgi:hypothetical protein
MEDRRAIQPAQSAWKRWLMAACAIYFMGLGRAPAEPTTPPPKPQDLTGMSLEDLLHEEIVPVNVLGSHTHLKHQIMVGYRYMFMEMDDNLDGTRVVSPSEVLQSYTVAHTKMTMAMHMLDLMYAPSDRLTFMAMIPYDVKTMDHIYANGAPPSHDDVSGLGDVSFMGLINLFGDPRANGNRLILNAGFTAPTGSINEGENGQRYEYEMQLGSGTFDLLPGLSYQGESDTFAWGAQVLGTVRLGSNANDYRLGNAYRLSAWTQVKLTDWFGPSIRLDWHAWGNIHGADPTLDPTRNPAFDPTKQSGERLDFLAGLNFYIGKGVLKGNRFSVEGGVPLYQNIAGPNMGVNWMISAAWTYTF